MIHGVDVSKYQGVIDFAKLKTKAQYLFIRGASAKNEDPYLASNVRGAAQYAIPWGLYFVPIPVNLTAFKVQAEFHAMLWKQSGGQLFPAIDLETDGGLNKNDLGNWLEKYMKWFMYYSGIEQLEKIITYTRASWFDVEMPLTNTFWRTQLWAAHYNTVIQAPKIPLEWSNHKKTWVLWQYSADGNNQGDAYGASSDDIDLDRFNGDAAKFEDLFGVKPGELETPPPPTIPASVTAKHWTINIRNKPTLAGSDVGNITGGSVLPVIGEDGEFWKVGLYVHKTVVR